MIFFLDLLFVIVMAIALTAIFAGGFRRRTTWDDFIWFFIILVLMIWAFGGWIPPFGPVLWGVVWMPFLITGILVALLLTAFIEPPQQSRWQDTTDQCRKTKTTFLIVDAFLGILILGLIIMIIMRYVQL